MRLPILALLLACAPLGAGAQAVARKHLLTAMGGGVGLLSLDRVPDSVSAAGALCGTVSVHTAYAFGRRFSLGVQYSRIGTDRIGPAVDQVRLQAFALTFHYRPWVGERAFAEAWLALGRADALVDLHQPSLPVVGNAGFRALGARYAHMLSGTIGAYAGIELAGGDRQYLRRYDGSAFTDAEGRTGAFDWSSQRLLAGLLVRF